MNTFIVVPIQQNEVTNAGSGLHLFLGGRAFFLFLFAGECRERDGIQSNDRL
jgi:hypothetical protein